MKNIKQRKSNVQTTRQIIRAMDMVAATKLNKARPRVEGIRPLYHEIQRQVAALEQNERAATHPFIAPRPVKSTGYFVITSNKGLCGSYNINVCRAALEHMEQVAHEKIVVMGSKGHEFFRQEGKNILRSLNEFPEAQIYHASGQLGEIAASRYLAGEVDEFYLVYTHFESTLSHLPRIQKLLPLPIETGRYGVDGPMKYEPDVHTYIDHLVPLYLHTCFFAALSESSASEHAARMVNMDAAGKNATDVINDLNRLYNRKRQANITQELNEIIGGANILE